MDKKKDRKLRIKKSVEKKENVIVKQIEQQIQEKKEQEPKSDFAKSTLKYFLISFVLFVGLVIIGGYFFKSNQKIEIKEAQLTKNTQLAIIPGENYVYIYNINNTKNNLTFQISDAGKCTYIRVKEAINETGVCVDKNGNDKSNNNATLENPYIGIFKPWMLAVSDNWEWNIKMIVTMAGTEMEIQNINYKTIGKEKVFGRDSFIVKLTSGNDSIINWIDKEKRILLKEKGQNYEIDLVSAPFVLNETN